MTKKIRYDAQILMPCTQEQKSEYESVAYEGGEKLQDWMRRNLDAIAARHRRGRK